MKKLLLVGTAFAALAGAPATAGQISGAPFTVSVTVQAGCVIQSGIGNVTFIANQGGMIAPNDVYVSPQVTCTNGTSYQVSFTSTNGVTGTERQMTAPSAGYVGYQIFGCANLQGQCDPGNGAIAIGDNPASGLAVPSNGMNGQFFQLLFRISGGSTWAANAQGGVTYTDTVTMQVNF